MAPGTIACCTGGREHSATVHGRATALAEATGAGLVFVPDLHLTEGRPRAIRARLPPDVFLVVRTAACPRSFGAPASDYDRGWLRALPCSVWVMPAYDGPQRRVVVAAVGLDGEGDFPLDVEVLSAAETIAQVEDAHLVVVHAWSLIGESIINCPVRGLGPRRGRRILRQMRQEREEMLKSFV
ncbi:MAG: hypothetical protein OEZ37_13735, partial [Gemmatimonadota bacterium]|nr:hypothetical protein [Gemmatimonadota bacterium]